MDWNPAPYPQGLDGTLTEQEWAQPLAKIVPPSFCLPFILSLLCLDPAEVSPNRTVQFVLHRV